jgi:valyl-tRNA synthetase
MSEIPKAYEPQYVEDKWYDFWLKQGCFTADPARVTDKRPAYSIVIPPPNITGVLHMGHVLNNTIQDILSRKARMDGKEVLWLPGTDHAGIATQTVVERTLKKTREIKHRDDLGREKFVERVWEWKEKHGGIIIQQLKKLGCSCDWTRERFTMDPEYSRCVQKVFVELYKKGLIYRGKRMVNWCPASLTALSDEEVIMKPQTGALYYFRVEIAKSPGMFLTIATTRPETIPGDTAVAVNPKDPRYAQYIGKHVVRPLPAELPREKKLIPIIGDEHVDFEFGTGVLKVTPAHDMADFEIGVRHKLAQVDIMNPDGTMNILAGGALVGLDRFEARKKAVEILKELGALEKEEPYTNNVGFSERADVPIEPRLSEQWFLKYPSVEEARACVANDEEVGRESSRAHSSSHGSTVVSPHQKMRFHPDRWARVYEHWMENIKDWCISRQLWWGHRVPVWTFKVAAENFRKNKGLEFLVERICDATGQVTPDGKRNISQEKITEFGKPLVTEAGVCVFSAGDEYHLVKSPTEPEFELRALVTDDAQAQSLTKFGFTQDPDVLDTWFSSWLWPFATMGWTGDEAQDSKNPALKAFYPTTDLVTAPEIIFFWVARMIMAGYEFMGEMPFRNVYFTGIIRDKQGRKMSKSLGNSPDPLDLIAKYGADAVRFGTMRSAPLGQDVMFDEKDVELGRNFCNKLWNACRFRQMQGNAGDSPANEGGSPEQSEIEGEIDPALLTSDDKWILLKLDEAIRQITDAFADYKFSDATTTLYRFFWSEYCDWYVEASKAVLGKPTPDPSQEGNRGEAVGEPRVLPGVRANKLAVIDFVLSHMLRLFHPFLPFITEELWQGMGYSHDLPEDQGGKTIMSARWPKPLSDDEKAHYGLDEATLKFVDTKYEVVTRGRNLRREFNIPANKKVKFILKVKDPLPAQEADVIKLLLNAEMLDVDPNYTPKKGTPSVITELGELFLPLEGLVDVEAEKARLVKELAKNEAEIEKGRSKLNNPSFVEKVPPSVLEEHKKRLADWQTKQQQVKAALSALDGQ